MSSENINNLLVQDFLNDLTSTTSGVKIAVLNIRRNVNTQSLLDEETRQRSVFIQIDNDKIGTEELKAKLAEEFASKDFVFLNFSGYLSTEIFVLLEGIHKNGWIDINKNGKDVPDRVGSSRAVNLILVSERKFVESQHGNLNNLTTHVLDLENE